MAAKSTKQSATIAASAPASLPSNSSPPVSENAQYLVVARRYRPQSFADLVGQSHVSTAISNAIQQNRVGHAYLFSGARGTGKTSSARIFAKCLNCEKGPTVQPCQVCDSCQGITSGDDIDVLEIDGASNRRIEEIRQLRSTVNVRPSRARYKIYIIDEVHMLTKEAFNALLKTLEEPPDHVKFIFCTTELDKIPITIRSRCQLFEFTPVEEGAIRERLKQIAATEKVDIAADALTLLARRAAGSMRDSQSLLEQLLATGQAQITLSDVNQFLGTADAQLVGQLVQQLATNQSSSAMGLVQQAFRQGVDAGQLTAQLLGFFRDCLAASVGCGDELLLNIAPDQCAQVRELAKQIGPEQSLAVAQILDECLVKMRSSTHPQVLLEMSLIRICRLEQLQALSDLIEQLRQNPEAVRAAKPANPPLAHRGVASEIRPISTVSSPGGATTSKKNDLTDVSITQTEPNLPPQPATEKTSVAAASLPVNATNVESVWKETLRLMADTAAEMAGQYHRLEWKPDGRILVTLAETHHRFCNRPDPKSRVEKILSQVTGQAVRVEFVAAANTIATAPSSPPPISKLKQMRDVTRDPLVQSAMELFDAAVTDVIPPRTAVGQSRPASGTQTFS